MKKIRVLCIGIKTAGENLLEKIQDNCFSLPPEQIEVVGDDTLALKWPQHGAPVDDATMRADISSALTMHEFDLIVVGNNLGWGEGRAAHIPAEYRPITLIVWNEYVPGDEIRYAEMGFTYFSSCINMDRVWRRMLGPDFFHQPKVPS